jgi:hypothetical protein
MRCALTVWMSMVVLVSGAGGMVLCIGEDGHVALEADHAGHCLPEHHSASPAACDAECDDHGCTGLELTAADCGGHDCVDVDLATDQALPLAIKTSPAPRPNASPTDLLPVPQLLAGTIDSHAGHSWLHGWDPSGSSPSLDAQRTVVLRI